MAMKPTDLSRLKGTKITERMKHERDAARPGATTLIDRREQRRLDQAAGLVPFAVKLNQDLVHALHERARAESVPLNALVEQLLRSGLGDAQAR